MKSRRWIAGLVASLCLGPACSGDTVPEIDRNAALRDLTDNVMLPTYRELGPGIAAMAGSLEALCADPGVERLTAARAAWSEGRGLWKRATAFKAGPMESLNTYPAVDFYPVNPAAVEALIAGSDPLTPDALDGVGTNRRGLPGIEVVLFDASRDATALVAALREGSGPSRRCQYLVAAGASVSRSVAAFVTAWEPAGGGYGRTLATAGQGSSISTSRAAVDLLVNQIINTLDTLQVSRLSVPNGSRNGGTQQPDTAESIPSGRSVADLADSLLGVRELYQGSHGARRGLGIGAMVAARNPALDAGVRAQFDAASRALAGVTVPVPRAVVEQRAQVETAIVELGRLKRLFRVDVANALGVTISFTDSDGD